MPGLAEGIGVHVQIPTIAVERGVGFGIIGMTFCTPANSLVTPFLFARSLTVSFFNPFRRAAAETEQGQIQIGVKWGRER